MLLLLGDNKRKDIVNKIIHIDIPKSKVEVHVSFHQETDRYIIYDIETDPRRELQS